MLWLSVISTKGLHIGIMTIYEYYRQVSLIISMNIRDRLVLY
jgi:hypothetical protein